MTLLLLLLAASLLGYIAGSIDQRHKRWHSQWWDGHRVGHDLGFKAGRLSRTERDEEGPDP